MRTTLSIALALLTGIAAPAAASARLQAPGAPGGKATWLPSDKHGFGTSRSRRSHVWSTLRRRAMSEVLDPDLARSIDAGRPVEQPGVVACGYAGRCG